MQPCAFVFRMTHGSVEEGGGAGRGAGGGGGEKGGAKWHRCGVGILTEFFSQTCAINYYFFGMN